MYIHLDGMSASKPSDLRHAPALPCACASLRRAARVVTHLYDQTLRRVGLRAPQFTLLQVLAALGEVSHGRLGQVLALDSTTLTRTLGHLRRRGWIEVRPGEDRRQRWLRLTPAGWAQLAQAQPHWEGAQRRLRQALGEKAWRSLRPGLARLAAAARAA